MALQGTVDTFPLPDVVRMLASTGKSGRLRVTGDIAEGSLWFADGALVQGELAGSSRDVSDVLLALFRMRSGSFRFDQGDVPTDDVEPVALEAVLDDLDERLAEWEALEAIVPSMEVRISLRPDIGTDEVTVDGAAWRAIATIGSGIRAGDLAELLDLGELEAMRAIAGLVERGLVTIGEPGFAPRLDQLRRVASLRSGGPEAEPTGASFRDLATVVDRVAPLEPDHGSHADDEDLDEPRADTGPDIPPAPAAGDAFFDHDPTGAGEPAQPGDDPRAGRSEEVPDSGEPEPSEIARQLASLSPKAAQAVARAARATTDEEREEALSEIELDGSVDRDVLMRFLGRIE